MDVPSPTALTLEPREATVPQYAEQTVLQQQFQLGILLAGVLLIGLMMLLPELFAYLGNRENRGLSTLV